MRSRLLALIACCFCLIPQGAAQRQHRSRGNQANPTAVTGAYKEPAATMRGILKRITSKQIIMTVEGDETANILRTRKTKFLQKGKEIKPEQIQEGSLLSIDVGKDPDLNPIAINVMVDAPPDR